MVRHTVGFAEDDESVGLAVWAVRGPRYEDFERRAAINMLWKCVLVV